MNTARKLDASGMAGRIAALVGAPGEHTPEGAEAIVRGIRRARSADEVLLALHHALSRVQRRERVSLVIGELPVDAPLDYAFPITLTGSSIGYLGVDRAPGAGPLDAGGRELFELLAREIAVALQSIAFASAWGGCARPAAGDDRW